MKQEYCRPKELAERLGVKLSCVWKWKQMGKLPPAMKMKGAGGPGAVLWKLSDIDAWLENEWVQEVEK